MVNLFELKEKINRFDELSTFVWRKWGTTENYNFYKDCMKHSLDNTRDVPKFYFAADGERVIGCCALLRSELIARQDLTPWVACLFVEQAYRGNGVGSKLLDHAIVEARQYGYQKLYLSTSLTHYYEKYGWTYLADSYDMNGDMTRVYMKEI